MCPQRVILAATGECRQIGHDPTSDPQIRFSAKENEYESLSLNQSLNKITE